MVKGRTKASPTSSQSKFNSTEKVSRQCPMALASSGHSRRQHLPRRYRIGRWASSSTIKRIKYWPTLRQLVQSHTRWGRGPPTTQAHKRSAFTLRRRREVWPPWEMIPLTQVRLLTMNQDLVIGTLCQSWLLFSR